MRFDGDHTPEEFEKARRMEDVSAPRFFSCESEDIVHMEAEMTIEIPLSEDAAQRVEP